MFSVAGCSLGLEIDAGNLPSRADTAGIRRRMSNLAAHQTPSRTRLTGVLPRYPTPVGSTESAAMPSVNPSTFTFSSSQLKPSALLGTASGITGSRVLSWTPLAVVGLAVAWKALEVGDGKVALARSGDDSTSSMLIPGRSCETRLSRLAKRFSTLDKCLGNA